MAVTLSGPSMLSSGVPAARKEAIAGFEAPAPPVTSDSTVIGAGALTTGGVVSWITRYVTRTLTLPVKSAAENSMVWIPIAKLAGCARAVQGVGCGPTHSAQG